MKSTGQSVIRLIGFGAAGAMMVSKGIGMDMEDIRIYQIRIEGQIVESEIAPFSPPGWKLEPGGKGASLLTVKTDQSGLVGLIRHLHGLGFALISIHRN